MSLKKICFQDEKDVNISSIPNILFPNIIFHHAMTDHSREFMHCQKFTNRTANLELLRRLLVILCMP